MLRLFVFLLIVGCALSSTRPAGLLPQLDGRIVGGADTTIENHPYQVSLQKSGSHFCGGSLYDSKTIVTAAHCLQNVKPEQITVRLGSTTVKSGNSGVFAKVSNFKYHEGYNANIMKNDIAIIRLQNSVEMNTQIRSIALAKTTPPTGTTAVVTGWGVKKQLSFTIPDVLQQVEVDIVDEKDCSSDPYKYGKQVTETMVCAYSIKKDACQGDSGGPLVANGVLVGVVSWGYGCAQPNYPGVYADVASLRNWVESNLNSI